MPVPGWQTTQPYPSAHTAGQVSDGSNAPPAHTVATLPSHLTSPSTQGASSPPSSPPGLRVGPQAAASTTTNVTNRSAVVLVLMAKT